MLSVVNKVSIGEIDDASLFWRKLKNTGQAYATLTGLSLEEYQTYTVMVRGVNKAGLHSQTVTQNVTVETSPPVCIGKLSIIHDSTELITSAQWLLNRRLIKGGNPSFVYKNKWL